MSFRSEKESFLRNVVHHLISLVAFLLEVIKQKDEELLPKYRLVDWREKKGIGYCRVHLVGTNSINDYTPDSIANDDDFITGFSKIDIRTITNLANREKYKSKAFVSSVIYEEKIVEITKIGQERTWIRVDDSLYNMIDDLSKTDAFNLGRMVGENDVEP